MCRQLLRPLRAATGRPMHIVGLSLPLLVLCLTRPPTIHLELGPRQFVLTTNPVIGVHTRLTDEVEPWKIQRTLQMVRLMGASYVVEFFPWPHIEPSEGQFNWDHTDLVIDHATNQGLTLVARLGWVPGWARPDPRETPTTLTHLEPEAFDEFAAYVAAFVERYRGRVSHVILWNEPNLSFEWGYRPVDPVAYTELLRSAYPRAHAANPQVIVLAGALAPTLEPEGSDIGLNDLAFLDRMYKAGAGELFDALAVHAYGLKSAPEAAPNADIINYRRVELLRDIMVDKGDENKPVFVTEAGWNDHPRWIHAVRPSERIQYTIRAFEWARTHWAWCPSVTMWAFRYPMSTLSYQDNYAFVTPDFAPRIIYREVQSYAVP
jgi:hypothetical protein